MSAPWMVITGTRKGLGKGLAEHYLEHGFRVAGCSRGEAAIEHERYRHYRLDVACEQAVVAMMSDVRRQDGAVEVLLNNAAIASMNHLVTTPASAAASIMSTNVVGSFLFLREAAKAMIPRKRGRIVNFATVATPLRLEGEALYAASKAAVVSLTEIAARELAPFGVRVNAIGPTPVPTDLIKNVPGERLEALLRRQAIPRFGTLADIVNVIDFFLAPASDFVTGQVVYLGGVHA